jgi:hypothetical protein
MGIFDITAAALAATHNSHTPKPPNQTFSSVTPAHTNRSCYLLLSNGVGRSHDQQKLLLLL